MSRQILSDHLQIWQHKPVLRSIYTDFYRRITGACRPGRTLEVGGGTGNLKDFSRDVVSTDIVPAPWLDAAADAQALPFVKESFTNVVAVDVLHHIERPRRFLSEIERVLEPRGRFILLEPAITPVSWALYHFCHPEPVMMRTDPLCDGPSDRDRKPFDANQAIPTLLFGRYRTRLQEMFPNLTLLQVEKLSLFAYPLSGGFRSWCLVPMGILEGLLRLERRLAPLLGRLMAFRMLVVMEKADPVKQSCSHAGPVGPLRSCSNLESTSKERDEELLEHTCYMNWSRGDYAF
jgi:SAM-dependent methyltransferase